MGTVCTSSGKDCLARRERGFPLDGNGGKHYNQMGHISDTNKYPFVDPIAVRKKMVGLVRKAELAETKEEHDKWMEFAIRGISPLELMEFLRDWDDDIRNMRCKIEELRRNLQDRLDA
jgi:hypothetical protein